MYYERALRIKYQTSAGATELTHENNIYIRGRYNGTQPQSEWQNVIIGIVELIQVSETH
jgi:hypothetical protein